MKEIPIVYKGSVLYNTKVDDSDYELVSKHKWYDTKGYVRTKIGGKSVAIHTLIMNTPKGMEIDHINHDPSDNRRENLRICTRSENCSHRAKFKSNISGYKGVSWAPKEHLYRASIKKDGKYIGLMKSTDPVEAARAYDKAALELHGEFAVINGV